jgi:hypothetical protein
MSAIVCPRCGGSQCRLIAPGYYECTSQVVAAVVAAGTQGVIQNTPVYGVCGHRYQAAGGLAPSRERKCGCGFLAVAGCVTCDTPLCGPHAEQGLRQGRVYCAAHAADTDRAIAAATAAEQSLADTEHAHAVAMWEAQVVTLLNAVSDRVERNIRARVEIRHDPRNSELQAMRAETLDHDAVDAWFLGAVTADPSELVREKHGRLRRRERIETGWLFWQHLSDEWNSARGQMQHATHRLWEGHIYYFSDGRVEYRPREGETREPKLSIDTLRKMLGRTSLRPLSFPPFPRRDGQGSWSPYASWVASWQPPAGRPVIGADDAPAW